MGVSRALRRGRQPAGTGSPVFHAGICLGCQRSLDRECAQGYKQVNAYTHYLGNKLDLLTVYRVVDGADF